MVDEEGGKAITVKRRRGFGEYALTSEFPDRSISVFVHRGDTLASGEGSSGSCFLGRRRRDHEPLSLLFDSQCHVPGRTEGPFGPEDRVNVLDPDQHLQSPPPCLAGVAGPHRLTDLGHAEHVDEVYGYGFTKPPTVAAPDDVHGHPKSEPRPWAQL